MKENNMLIKNGSQYFRLLVDDILYVQVVEKHCVLFTHEMNYTYRCSLTKLLADLPFKNIVRAHRFFAVNWNYVTGISNDEIYLGKRSVPLGPAYAKDLKLKYIHDL